ncbi:MAG: ribonuclease Z [Spirochaetia bacterium]|nr:ribonuclease Z [Spirochaetia bacterium]
MNLEIFILGTGGMMPLPNRFLTSALLRRDGDLFLFDCGEGTQVSLKKLNLRWKKITKIFISHMHADHVTGLAGILMLSSQVDRTEPLHIYGPQKISEYVLENRRILDMYINYEIIIHEFKEPGIIVDEEDYYIKIFKLDHTKPCYGYSFVEKPRPGIFFPEKAEQNGVPRGPLWSKLQKGESVENSKGRIIHPVDVMGDLRKGRKFSFVTDTAFINTISEEVKDSDLFICEGMFEKELQDSAKEKKHLTSEQAGIIARSSSGIKKMGLIHYSPRYIEKDLKKLLIEAREHFPDTFLCRDRQRIELFYEE